MAFENEIPTNIWEIDRGTVDRVIAKHLQFSYSKLVWESCLASASENRKKVCCGLRCVRSMQREKLSWSSQGDGPNSQRRCSGMAHRAIGDLHCTNAGRKIAYTWLYYSNFRQCPFISFAHWIRQGGGRQAVAVAKTRRQTTTKRTRRARDSGGISSYFIALLRVMTSTNDKKSNTSCADTTIASFF